MQIEHGKRWRSRQLQANLEMTVAHPSKELLGGIIAALEVVPSRRRRSAWVGTLEPHREATKAFEEPRKCAQGVGMRGGS